MIIFDNRLPEFTITCLVDFTVTDNGSGTADPRGELNVPTCCGGEVDLPLLGGNYTVR